MAVTVVRADIVTDFIDTAAMARAVADPQAGAVVTFEGVIRRHDHGEAVQSIDYSSHPQAGEVLARIAQECGEREGIHRVAVSHRIGHLVVGDVAMVVTVSAEHRRQGFECAAAIVDEVKARVPIWKQQFLADGSHEWVGLPS